MAELCNYTKRMSIWQLKAKKITIKFSQQTSRGILMNVLEKSVTGSYRTRFDRFEDLNK
jgi:hypothetical protein